MEIIVYADCHRFGPSPVNVKFEFGSNVFYIGDNHELKNIKKSKVNRRVGSYKQFLKVCKETNTNVLAGNHEVSPGTIYCGVRTIVKEINGKKVLFVHGDYPLWEEAKRNKWHNRHAGIGRFTLFGIKIKNTLRDHSGSKSLSNKKIDIFTSLAKEYGCDIVVFGHTHPKKTIDETHNGIRIINAAKGRNIINI